jgi:hypothetical protein
MNLILPEYESLYQAAKKSIVIFRSKHYCQYQYTVRN